MCLATLDISWSMKYRAFGDVRTVITINLKSGKKGLKALDRKCSEYF